MIPFPTVRSRIRAKSDVVGGEDTWIVDTGFGELDAGRRERRLLRSVSEGLNAIGTFGGGTHLCLGHNLAHIQTPLALAALLKHYDYELLETPSLDYVLDPVTTPIEKAISIELRSRAAPRSTI